MSVAGHWFLITAGHVVDGIHNAIKNGQILCNFELNDTWAQGGQYADTIPFDRLALLDPRCYIYDEEAGIDCACTYLRPHYRDLLTANNVEALSEQAWERVPTAFDAYWMLGVPDELGVVELSGAQVCPRNRCILLPVSRLDAPPASLKKKADRFYGQVPRQRCGEDGTLLDSIKGMSGGPIFGMRKSGQAKSHCWVIAIQSGWNKTEAIIAGYPIGNLGRVIRDTLIPGLALPSIHV